MCAFVVLGLPASEMTYIVSSGALNSTPTNQLVLVFSMPSQYVGLGKRLQNDYFVSSGT